MWSNQSIYNYNQSDNQQLQTMNYYNLHVQLKCNQLLHQLSAITISQSINQGDQYRSLSFYELLDQIT